MKLRIIALILAIAACVLAFCSCGKKETSVPDGMQLASSEDTDYVMYVPEDWKVDKSTLYTAAYCSADDPTSISTTAYGMNYDDTNVDDWFVRFTEEFKAVYTDVSEAKSEKATLGGIEGMKYTFSGTLNKQVYDYVIVAVLRKNYIYYITYTSTPVFYEEHLEDLNNVITNFAFID